MSMKPFLTLFAALAIASPALAKETVLVAGATGGTGRAVVKALLQDGYTVRAMVRDAGKASDLGAGVQIVVADVTKPETLPAAVKGADFVLSALGAVPAAKDSPEAIDYKGIAALTDAAKAAGVKHFIHMTSLGAGKDDPKEALNRIFQMVLVWKGKGEEHIRKSGMAWTVVRPGGLTDCEPGKIGLKLGHLDGTAPGRVCRADAGLVMVAAMGNKDYMGKTISVIEDKSEPVDGWRRMVAAIPKD